MTHARHDLLLGIDIGTTALKAVVLDPAGGIVAQATRPHTLRSLHAGWAEMDPHEWWATTQAACRELTARVGAERIAAVGVTGMVPAMVALDGTMQPLRASIQQNDARALAEVADVRALIGDAASLAVTGGVVSQQQIGPRWRWVQRHEPEIAAQTRHLCGSYDLITQHLTGVLSLELNWAVESGLFDIRSRDWHQPFLDLVDIDVALFPPVREPATIVGVITPEAAAVTGLRAGTPVVAGSADHVAAALASGIAAPGEVLLKFGGGGDVLACADRAEPHPAFFFDFHNIPGLALINGCMATSGSFVRWFQRVIGGGADLALLDAEAAAVSPGAGGVIALPYLLGEKTPLFDPEARGVFVGLMLHHERGHLFRAVLEGICCGFRHHLDLLREDARPVTRLLAADGGTRSPLWMQITADTVGAPLQVVTGDAASAVGVAFVAGMGIGAFGGWDDVRRFVSVGPVYEPRPDAARVMDDAYAIYRDLYTSLTPVFPRLGALERPL